MMTPDQISLARAAVVAKVTYWDALRAFEVATTDNSNKWNEWSSRVGNQVHETVEHIASCCGGTADDLEWLTDEDLEQSFGFLSNLLTLSHPL